MVIHDGQINFKSILSANSLLEQNVFISLFFYPSNQLLACFVLKKSVKKTLFQIVKCNEEHVFVLF